MGFFLRENKLSFIPSLGSTLFIVLVAISFFLVTALPAKADIEISDGSVTNYWHFNNTTGDSAGTVNWTDHTPPVATTTGKFDTTYSYGNDSNYLLQNGFAPDPDAIHLWIRAVSPNARGYFFAFGQNAVNPDRDLWLGQRASDGGGGSGNYLWFGSDVFNGPGFEILVSSAIGDNQFHEVDLVRRDGVWYVYFDAAPVPVNSVVETTHAMIGGSTIHAHISHEGNLEQISSGDLGMTTEELLLKTGDLSTSTIQALYNSGQGQKVCLIAGCGTAIPSVGNLAQFKSDGIIPLGKASTTTEDTVVFGATLNSSSSDPLRLEVEYTTTTFSGIVNATSVPVSPGTFATATISGLADGNYHWRARAISATTSAVSAWVDLGNGSSPDFVVHQVPLYTQVVSDFPSLNATQDWAGKKYGNGKYSCSDSLANGSSTIRSCGCAIVSLVMISRYYGATSDINNSSVDPDAFNAWLTSVSATSSKIGYNGGGSVWWSSIDKYTNGQILFHNVATGTMAFLTDALNTELMNLRPTILFEPSVRKGHYIVADSQLATTYHIRDPYFYGTRYLTGGNNTTTTHNYGNQFESLRTFRQGTLGVIPSSISFAIASPAELLLTDPIGRRLGRDPSIGLSYNEIPDSSYFIDSVGGGPDDATSTGHEVKTIWISSSTSGIYNVQVIGTASGTYTFSGLEYDASGASHAQEFIGNTQNNLITPYVLNFTPQSSSSISLVSQLNFGGFLDPVKADGSGLYKLNRVLPVKFQLTNASGTVLTDHTAQLFVAKIQDGVAGTDEILLSAGNADVGNYFRVSGNQYIYNLDTGELSAGTWQLKVILDDGVSYTVFVSMKN